MTKEEMILAIRNYIKERLISDAPLPPLPKLDRNNQITNELYDPYENFQVLIDLTGDQMENIESLQEIETALSSNDCIIQIDYIGTEKASFRFDGGNRAFITKLANDDENTLFVDNSPPFGLK